MHYINTFSFPKLPSRTTISKEAAIVVAASFTTNSLPPSISSCVNFLNKKINQSQRQSHDFNFENQSQNLSQQFNQKGGQNA